MLRDQTMMTDFFLILLIIVLKSMNDFFVKIRQYEPAFFRFPRFVAFILLF